MYAQSEESAASSTDPHPKLEPTVITFFALAGADTKEVTLPESKFPADQTIGNGLSLSKPPSASRTSSSAFCDSVVYSTIDTRSSLMSFWFQLLFATTTDSPVV